MTIINPFFIIYEWFKLQYSLSDFENNGSKEVRNTEDCMKNYFVNKYGAIKDIDFSDIVIDDERNEK